jgi:pyruvate dehydrogenase E1 component
MSPSIAAKNRPHKCASAPPHRGLRHHGHWGYKVHDIGLGLIGSVLSDRQAMDGQVLEEGISEAGAIPNSTIYDTAFAGEMAVISDHGMRAMLVEQKDVFYYATLMNENYAQPDLPAGVEADVMRFCYKFSSYKRISDGG